MRYVILIAVFILMFSMNAFAADSVEENSVFGNAINQDFDLSVGSFKVSGTPKNFQINNHALNLGEVSEAGEILQFLQRNKSTFSIMGRFLLLITIIITGLVLLKWFRRFSHDVMNRFRLKPWKSFGWGIIVLILTPIISLLFVASIVLSPVGIFSLFIWGFAIYLSLVFISMAFGEMLFRAFNARVSRYLMLVIGAIILFLLLMIPIVAPILIVISVLIGMGAIFGSFFRYLKGGVTAN